MKVGIIIICYNIDSRIFLLQINSLKKFCTDDFEINVFDNGYEKEKCKAIKYHCERMGIEYKRTKAGSKNGSDSHAFALRFAYDFLKNKYDYFFFLDHDVIPLKPFSVIETLGLKLMAGIGQGSTYKYFWIGNFMANTTGIDKDLIDFGYSHELNLDTGGLLYKVIEKYGMENFIFFDEVYCEIDGFTGKEAYYTIINDGGFIHYVGGSNWENNTRHEERMNALLNITQELINETE